MNILDLMAAPFVECLVLVAVHTYLGIHVLKRRVIFVDLALAQTAALGTTVGFFFGIMPDTTGALIFSIGFALLGAAVFSVTRFRHEKVPQEAVIGLSYAIACAMAVMVVEKTQGAEHLKDILVGNLLWVTWKDVLITASVYLVIGAIHVIFRKRFFLISDDPEAAYRAGISVRAWDFLFYVTFAMVITLSTRVAGVLLVFVFLVAPAILAFTLTSRLRLQLIIGWVCGTVVTVLGLYLSWSLDLPSGPAVIAFYGVVLVLAGVVVFLWRSENRLRASRATLIGCVITALVVLGMWRGGRWLGGSSISVSDEARQIEAEVSHDQADIDEREHTAEERCKKALSSRVGRCVGANKLDRYLSLAGPEERLQHAKNKLAGNLRRGLEFLVIALADDELPLLYREEGFGLLAKAAGEDFGYDPQKEACDNEAAFAKICDRIQALRKQAAGDEGGDDE